MARRSAGALAGLWLSVAVQAASAAGLVEVWQAAAQNDAEHAVARAAQATAQPRRDQAAALWRPSVGLAATVGVASHESESRGAQFSAPGLGSSSGVGFSTSVNNGSAGRWSVTASQPLYNPERRAQQRQLGLAAEIADLEWLAAGQTLMLRTAERYFDLALAEEALRVLTLQQGAVQRATAEVQDRFKLGDVPVTDTHEAVARLAGIRAQVLAAHSDLQIKRNLLADSTGLPEATLVARLPAGGLAGPAPRALQAWLDDARAGNPGNRIALLGAELARQEAAKYSRRGAPTLDLVAQAGRDRLSGSGDYGSASNTASQRMIGLQLTLPLYAGDYREAKQDEALRLADKAAAEAERSRQQVAQQVRAAWLASSVGAERVQALAEALQASEARLDATRLGQTVGDRTTLDRLNAENDAAAARLALAQGRVGLLLSRLRLAALAGQIDEAALLTVDRELVAASP
jgi:outer membrane protein